MKLTTPLHIVARLMRGAIPPLAMCLHCAVLNKTQQDSQTLKSFTRPSDNR